MKFKISASKAVRQFGDCLARVKYRGDRFVITKNDEPVAELAPVAGVRRGTLGDVLEVLRNHRPDSGFADDLEAIGRADRPLKDPWES